MSEGIWTVLFSRKAEKQLLKLDYSAQNKIREFIDKIMRMENPRPLGHQLRGELSKYWRFRVGDYRLITEIIDHTLVIDIIRVGHRREVYD
jgi:mRNA interferase RelE/StbE